MSRQLVLCLDGTGNQLRVDVTNIVRIHRMLERHRDVRAFYSPGLGTFGLKETLFEWQKIPSKVLGLAFGWGLRRNVEDAYRFVAEQYEPGAEIYVFGFSRGAYTARALAAMIRAVGLLPPQQANLFEYAWAALRARDESGRPDFELQGRYKATFARHPEVPIRFLGLFDTVKSVGWIYEPLVLPYTASNASVEVVRHAVSIDERRAFFRANLWRDTSGATDVKEVWFAGVHSDVGGGYPDARAAPAKVALRWMMAEAYAKGLRIDPTRYRSLVYADGAPPSPTADLNESLKGAWVAAEFVPRVYRKEEQGRFRTRVRFPLLQWRHLRKPRFIAELATVHESVVARINGGIGYLPPNKPRQWQPCGDLPEPDLADGNPPVAASG